MGNIKRGEDGMNLMMPEGLPMLDEMGQPIKLDERMIFLSPVMQLDGKFPEMEKGQPKMYPSGLPLMGPTG